jgi:hypothetical protein
MAVRSVRVKSDSTGAVPPRASLTKPTKRRPRLMSIRVHYNVGLGNRITVRGDTDPFRWDRGIDARNTAADVWEFQLERIPAGQTFQFKPLINDTTYSTGDNYVGTGRQTLDVYPTF